MFNDENLNELHKCKEYKRSNGFRKNFSCTLSIVKSEAGGISLSVLSSGNVSVSVNIIALLWFILRFWYITREFTYCRAKIIEGLLNDEYIVDRDRLIIDSIKANSMWMEYKQPKVEFLETACVKYLDTSENRTILISKSDWKSKEEKIQAIIKVRQDIKELFRNSKNELNIIEIKKIAMSDYSTATHDEECIKQLQSIFASNNQVGNLTNIPTKAESKE
jgi:hypothetical protein